MKKKTLLILLIIPFILGLLSFVSITILNNTVAADIIDIVWDYGEQKGFKINTKTELKAEAIIDDSLLLAPHSDELVWTLKNCDGTNEVYAVISNEDNHYYLEAKKEGSVDITCANKRGTKSKTFKGFIYEEGAILVERFYKSNNQNIDPNYYFGQYDPYYSELTMDGLKAVPSKLKLKTTLDGATGDIYMEALTSNIAIENNEILIKAPGPATIKFFTNTVPYLETTYSVEIIKDAYNIYNYNDLLMATNFSSTAKDIVMQVDLDSLENIYERIDISSDSKHPVYKYLNKKSPHCENKELFGNFDFDKQEFSFDKEVSKVKSTYNTKFIRQCNLENNTDISDKILVGINLKGNLYGNGYLINTHGLSFPNHGKVDTKGYLEPGEGDYFFGPLGLVSIGSIEKDSLVKAYGQDNAVLMMNGDGLKINDIKIRGSNEIDEMYNLVYCGSVIDVNGHNNEISNSILSNGRTIIRAFSANGLKVNNSILQKAGEFIMKLGSNTILPYDESKNITLNYENKTYNGTLDQVFDLSNTDSASNNIIDNILLSSFIEDETKLKETLNIINDIQSSFDNISSLYDNNNDVIYSDQVEINDCYFYRSGIFSIAFESIFNGPYLYNGGSNTITDIVKNFQNKSSIPHKVGGTSSPVKLLMDSNSKFYDWKEIKNIDASILIEENLSSLFGDPGQSNIDSFFPIKGLLKEACSKNNLFYNEDGKNYINSKIAYYGGGANLSNFSVKGDNKDIDFSNPLIIDFVKAIMSGHLVSQDRIATLLAHAVMTVIGAHPFKFVTNKTVSGTPIDYGKVPQVSDLKTNFSRRH